MNSARRRVENGKQGDEKEESQMNPRQMPDCSLKIRELRLLSVPETPEP